MSSRANTSQNARDTALEALRQAAATCTACDLYRRATQALAQAGIDRDRLYVTNAVKHFKWKPAEGGKRRIHERPRPGEVAACRPWFQQELRLIRPDVLVCLGATAARAALGRAVTIAAARGGVLESSSGNPTVVTMHPSAILRTRDKKDRQAMMRALVADLRVAARVAGKTGRPA